MMDSSNMLGRDAKEVSVVCCCCWSDRHPLRKWLVGCIIALSLVLDASAAIEVLKNNERHR